GVLFAAVVIGGAIALKYASGTLSGKRFLERVILKSPAVGKVTARFALVRFCRMLGTLVGAGVPLVASLRVAKEAIGNQTLSDSIGVAIEEVQRGASLAKRLSGNNLLFPASLIEMITVAEETGRLDKELMRLAAIVVPKMTGRTQEAKIAATKSSISNCKTALDLFEHDNDRFPSTEEGLTALTENPGNLQNWHKYMDTVPVDGWGHPLTYKIP